MIRPILIFLLFGLMLTGLSAQSPVFVNAYNNEIFGNDLVFTGGGDLLIAGDKAYPSLRPNRNRSDFGLMRVDSAGHPLMTQVYHLMPNDHLAYVKNAPGGYVWGGMSGKRQDHALLVITRTNLRGQVRWARAFRPLHRGPVVLSGLDVNRQGEVVFAAFTRTRVNSTPTGTTVLGILAKLDSAGNLLWSREIALGDRFPLEAAPHSSVAFGPGGAILAGWHFGRAATPVTPGSSGIAFQAYGPNGALRWSQSYRANALLAMTYVPADSGIAAYALDTARRSGLIRLDKVGNVQYAFLDDLQQGSVNAVRPMARIEADGARLPYALYQQLTLHVPPTASLGATMPAIAVERPALLNDFAVRGRQAYMVGSAFYPPNQKRYPVLLKSAFAQVDNCFTRSDSTRIRARFPLPPLNVQLSATAGALRDSTIRLRVRSLPTLDSLACIGDGDVWPGDANSDGIAEVKDVFAIGLAWNSRGPQRPNASLRWVGQPARNWRQDFNNGANFKHADCDGNGRVERADIQAIIRNYGRVHSKADVNGQPGDAPLYAGLPATLDAGTKVRVPVYLGDVQRNSDALHGIAFSVSYDPAVVGEDLSFTPVASWLGTPEQDLEYVAVNFPEDGVMEIGLTRTTGVDAQGQGLIGYLSFSLAVQLPEGQRFSLSLHNTAAINSREEAFLLYGQEATAAISPAQSLAEQPDTHLAEPLIGMSVYPNPATDHVTLALSEGSLQYVEILDLFGNVKWQQQANGAEARIQLPGLPEGLYFLRVHSSEGVATRQLMIE